MIAHVADTERCRFEKATDYKGGGGDIKKTSASSPEACCQACVNEPTCAYFTMDPGTGVCYLKKSPGNKVPNRLLVSGHVV